MTDLSPPLWQVMETAFLAGRNPGYCDQLGYAAELRVVAAWIKERHPLTFETNTYIGASVVAAELLAEADRAEAGLLAD